MCWEVSTKGCGEGKGHIKDILAMIEFKPELTEKSRWIRHRNVENG
jgi:hypothetical protein